MTVGMGMRLQEGARSVNMCTIDAPADVYTRISKM